MESGSVLDRANCRAKGGEPRFKVAILGATGGIGQPQSRRQISCRFDFGERNEPKEEEPYAKIKFSFSENNIDCQRKNNPI
ncbi:hypothetical protein LXL04_007416 [Taraxacum kok-saghyz]